MLQDLNNDDVVNVNVDQLVGNLLPPHEHNKLEYKGLNGTSKEYEVKNFFVVNRSSLLGLLKMGNRLSWHHHAHADYVFLLAIVCDRFQGVSHSQAPASYHKAVLLHPSTDHLGMFKHDFAIVFQSLLLGSFWVRLGFMSTT